MSVGHDISCDGLIPSVPAFDAVGLCRRAVVRLHIGLEAAVRNDHGPKQADQTMADGSIGKEGVMSWTEERVELLRKLWLEGLSASRIAAELAGGVTRNAVIGKVHRLGMSGRVKASTAMPAGARRPGKPMAEPSRQPLQRAAAMPMRGNLAVALQSRPMVAPQSYRSSGHNVVPMLETVTIMELRESMCRWPVGDPSSSEFRYCGGKSPIGDGPYCSFHSRMAYQPAQDRRARKIA